MSSLETIREETDDAICIQDECDYIIQSKNNTISVCKEKVEELITREASLYYKFGLIDGFLLGVAATMLTYTYKGRAASALKALVGTVKEFSRL